MPLVPPRVNMYTRTQTVGRAVYPTLTHQKVSRAVSRASAQEALIRDKTSHKHTQIQTDKTRSIQLYDVDSDHQSNSKG